MDATVYDYDTEQKRFIIELMTSISLENWHKNNLLLHELMEKDVKEIKGEDNATMA